MRFTICKCEFGRLAIDRCNGYSYKIAGHEVKETTLEPPAGVGPRCQGCHDKYEEDIKKQREEWEKRHGEYLDDLVDKRAHDLKE